MDRLTDIGGYRVTFATENQSSMICLSILQYVGSLNRIILYSVQ